MYRRYNDFVVFHEMLLQKFPYRMVPALPPKRVLGGKAGVLEVGAGAPGCWVTRAVPGGAGSGQRPSAAEPACSRRAVPVLPVGGLREVECCQFKQKGPVLFLADFRTGACSRGARVGVLPSLFADPALSACSRPGVHRGPAEGAEALH